MVMIKRKIRILGSVALAGLILSATSGVQAQSVPHPATDGYQHEQYQQQMEISPAQQEYMSNITIDELMDIQRQALGGRSAFDGYFQQEDPYTASSVGTSSQENENVKYRYKKKDRYFDGVEMPRRIFNNIPSKRY